MSSDKKNSIYFPGLNALRFLAAFLVVVTHIELLKHHLRFGEPYWSYYTGNGLETPFNFILNGKFHWLTPFVSAAGPIGVVFFFVLSGFLISYLLMAEKEKTGTIAMKAFYLRRIFRIWPLYFLIVFMGFFILPYFDFFYIPSQSENLIENFWPNLLLYLFMLPNLAQAIYNHIPHIGQTWSIGVEEQFYLIWPLLFKIRANIYKTMVFFFVGLVLLKGFFVLFDFGILSNSQEEIVKQFLAATKMECMAIGGMAAYTLFKKKDAILKIIYSTKLFYTAILSIPILVYFTPAVIQDAQHLVLSISFIIIILNVSSNDKCPVKLENKLFSFLGKISYGIYMYHFVICAAVIKCMKLLEVEYNFVSQTIIYVLVLGLTIFISWLSYEYLEKRFLTLKSKYQKVKSTS